MYLPDSVRQVNARNAARLTGSSRYWVLGRTAVTSYKCRVLQLTLAKLSPSRHSPTAYEGADDADDADEDEDEDDEVDAPDDEPPTAVGELVPPVVLDCVTPETDGPPPPQPASANANANANGMLARTSSRRITGPTTAACCRCPSTTW
ncbi:hypothetical protein GCM10027579_20500 [Calidifontibacter terrae]